MILDSSKMSVDIHFPTEEASKAFADYLRVHQKNAVYDVAASKDKVSIQANANITGPDLQQFYLNCIGQAKLISNQTFTQSEHNKKAKFQKDELNKNQILQTQRNINKLRRRSGLFFNPLATPSKKLTKRKSRKIPKLVIHTGEVNPKNEKEVKESVTAVLTAAPQSASVEFQGDPKLIRFLLEQLLQEMIALRLAYGGPEAHLLLDLYRLQAQFQTLVGPQLLPFANKILGTADTVSEQLLAEARKEAKAQIEAEDKASARADQQALSKVGINVSENTAAGAMKGLSLLGKGMSVLKDFMMFGPMGAIVGGTCLGMDLLASHVGPSREDKLTAQILQRKLQNSLEPSSGISLEGNQPNSPSHSMSGRWDPPKPRPNSTSS